MFIFVFLVVWAALIVCTALVASSKNRSSGTWGILGALFGIFALIWVACLEKLPTAMIGAPTPQFEQTKICPRCAETIKAAAYVCRFCKHEFDPTTVPVASTETLTDQRPDPASFPWTLVQHYGGGYGVYRYKGDKLIYDWKGVKWKGNSFDSPANAIAAVDSYHQ